MALVGIKAADASRKNFKALQRLSGHFYDRLQALTTIRLFDRTTAETEHMRGASEVFRHRTMDVLRIAFLSSAVLEFFTSISIALTAVYFGFSYIGELNFGYYGASVTLFAGLFVLILAPEFYQPLRISEPITTPNNSRWAQPNRSSIFCKPKWIPYTVASVISAIMTILKLSPMIWSFLVHKANA